jgi:hypothetical protein
MTEELEDALLELFGELYLVPLEQAKIPEDRYPSLLQVLSHIRECLDEDIFGEWVQGYIELETPQYFEELKLIKKEEEKGQLLVLSELKTNPQESSEIEEDDHE